MFRCAFSAAARATRFQQHGANPGKAGLIEMLCGGDDRLTFFRSFGVIVQDQRLRIHVSGQRRPAFGKAVEEPERGFVACVEQRGTSGQKRQRAIRQAIQSFAYLISIAEPRGLPHSLNQVIRRRQV